ncbi:MAG: polysaccharide pyruvyl transferase family protein, partial [Selenomonadaceae bacterium]|nr:polysaccharide pyruvyl transferase family protein [Selenomonadaceae bacterium]
HIEFLPIISEDETFAVALYCLTERYYIMPEVVYVWRRRSGSIMTTRNVERFSQNVRSIILGLQYTKNFLDAVPRFEGYEAWCRSVFYAFVLRFVNNHTYPYLKGTNVASEINAAAEKLFTEIFGDNAYFVKYFFLHYHTNRRQAENLTKQVEQFKAQQQNIVATFIREHPGFLELMASVRADGKKIFLMHTPRHGNIGDQAIVLGELRVLEKFFPEHKIIEVPTDYFRGDNGKLLWALGFETYVRRDDIIFLPGGGNLGNLWLGEEKIRRALIERFAQNKIVSFPQSIHFTDDDSGRAELATSQKIYGAHPDLHLMMRDENSFDFATKNFPSAKNYLLPDAATVLHGMTDDCTDTRQGVLFVLRGDKEKIRDDKNISRLQKYLADKNIPFTVTDTVIGGRVTSDIREQKVREVLMKFRRSKLVVTDRFHGVVFSFVTRTPVMAFKSFDTKISSGIRWFRNIPSIFYAEGQDWSRVENFIDTNYSAAEISAALNCKVETDGMERFVRALNQIVRKNEVATVEQNTPPPFT